MNDDNDGRRAGDDEGDPGMAALIRDARAGWNTPPETPREAIWKGVAAHLFSDEPGAGRPETELSMAEARARRHPSSRRVNRRGWLAVAAVALVVLGVGIGRMSLAPPGSAPRTASETVPNTSDRSGRSAPFRLATAAHLTSTETLLTLVRADARRGELDPAVGRWGRRLLTETRLLLDSPAVTDPGLRGLLEELEVVLAQVAMLADPTVDGERRRSELDLIARGLEDAGVEDRLRASLPSLTAGLGETD